MVERRANAPRRGFTVTRELPRVLSVVAISQLVLLAACSQNAGSSSNEQSGGSASNTGGSGSGGKSAAAGSSSGGSSAAMGGATGSSSGGSTSNTGMGGSFAAGGAASGGSFNGGSAGSSMAKGGSASSAGGSASGGASGGSASGGATHKDHCLYGYDPLPVDETMKDGPYDYYPPGKTDPAIVDTTLQPEVIKWMQDNFWQAAHVEWHAIRGCNVPGGGGLSKVNICSFTQLVPKDQNCQTAGDGYQFLLFHRHMMLSLKQLFPKHTEQFTGFPKFPTSAEDVPQQWRSAWRDWDANALAAGKIGDEIDKPENLARFANEGTLGFWLQCNVGQKLAGATNMPFVGLHFLLHAKWARPGNTLHGVNNTDSNIDNYMFYKLHGWIDNVWEKYRVAKGLKQTDQKYKDDLLAQCREMDTEINIIKNSLKPGDPIDPSQPLPPETGEFHTMVRPIFESQTNLCSGCHAETGANAGLSLGGNITSKKIVEGLVNRPSRGGGQFQLVVPGDPDRSWLYLKAAGRAANAGCVASSTAQCITGVMPPTATGPTVSATELQTLRQWILNGAKGPT